MIDKCLEYISPNGIHLGPERMFDLNHLRDAYGLKYQGGWGFDKFECLMKTRKLRQLSKADNMTFKVGGFVDSLLNMKPMGGEADVNCENLSSLLFFLQGGTLRISNNSFYLKADRDICPDEFAAVGAGRMLFAPTSRFLGFETKFDGLLPSSYNVLQDSIRAEDVPEHGAYKIIFDLEVTLKDSLEQIPYYKMRRPIPVRHTVKLYSILKNLLELPENFDFVFGHGKLDRSIKVTSVASFQSDYTLVRNILHLEKNDLTIHELGALFGAFLMDEEKAKVLRDFFGDWGAPDFYKIARRMQGYGLGKLDSDPIPGIIYYYNFSFKTGVRDKNFMKVLLLCKEKMEFVRDNLRGSASDEWEARHDLTFNDNGICVVVKCDRTKLEKDDLKRIKSFEHMECMKKFLQKGVDAFETLITILNERMLLMHKENGDFNYPGLKKLIERTIQDAVKLDPLSYIDYGCNEKRCVEIRDYARILIGGAN